MSTDRITIKIDGMHCDGCETSLRTALERLDGVQVLETSYEEGTVELLHDADRAGRDDLVEAVEEAGYDVVSI